MGALHRSLARAAAIVAAGVTLAGCVTVQGGPDRLYSVAEEVTIAREVLPDIIRRYNTATSETDRQFYRNEYVARRMYIIDVEYSEYEAALTSERQKFGFVTTASATGLGIASTLTTPVRSAQVLAGVGAAVLGLRGAYDSEVVIAKTLQIVQGHMRAQRDIIATRQILPRMTESTLTYPLSAALHNLEDYYRAGTFTAGLIPALRESGNAAEAAAEEKAGVLQGTFGADNATVALRRYLFNLAGGKLNHTRLKAINICLRGFQVRPASVLLHLDRAQSAGVRVQAIRCAQEDPEFVG